MSTTKCDLVARGASARVGCRTAESRRTVGTAVPLGVGSPSDDGNGNNNDYDDDDDEARAKE